MNDVVEYSMKDFIGLYVSGNRSVDSKIPTTILFKRDYLT